MTIFRYIPPETRSGAMNMALDEAVLSAVTEGKSPPTLRFYRWKPSCVSIGRNQSLSAEVDTEAAGGKGIDVVRRITGGGAVFHDSAGEITYSVVCSSEHLESLGAHKILEQSVLITGGITLGLKTLGVETEKGRAQCSAVFLGGKKISGNAFISRKHHVLQHGTLLQHLDPELMYSVLKAPGTVSRKGVVRSVYAKCTGIGKKLGNVEESEIVSALKKGFGQTLHADFEDSGFSEYEMKEAEDLAAQKYQHQEWLHNIQ